MLTVVITSKALRQDPLAGIKAKIHIWANWYRPSFEGGLPPHSLEGRAILRGGAAPRPQDAAHGLPSNAIAEQGLDRLERYPVRRGGHPPV